MIVDFSVLTDRLGEQFSLLLIMLQRPAVQRQLLALAAIVLLTWLAPRVLDWTLRRLSGQQSGHQAAVGDSAAGQAPTALWARVLGDQAQHRLLVAFSRLDASKMLHVEHRLNLLQPLIRSNEDHERLGACGSARIGQLLAAVSILPAKSRRSHCRDHFRQGRYSGLQTPATVTSTGREQGYADQGQPVLPPRPFSIHLCTRSVCAVGTSRIRPDR